MKTIVATGLLSFFLVGHAHAKAPTFTEILKSDLITKAKIRWIRHEKGSPITVEIHRGEAFRSNPDWNPQPVKLPYDLKKHADLDSAIKGGSLGPPTKRSAKTGDRMLQLLGEDDAGNWVPVGAWVMPAKVWKTRQARLYNMLEPLCDVMADVFQPVKDKPPEPIKD